MEKERRFHLDRNCFEVVDMQDVDDETNDLAYWLSRAPQERIQGIEALRQSLYNYDPLSERLPRVFTVTDQV